MKLRRKIYDDLMEWRSRPGHKPLLLRGQRQVGKTFILREFARSYPSSTYVDLSADPAVRDDFRRGKDVDRILESLVVRDPSFDPVPGHTLIILDEVQSSPPARSSLKGFCEDGRFDVVASGSLLDLPTRGGEGAADPVPVGYEEHMRMYGLDFEEFLWAKGYGGRAIDSIRRHIRERDPMTETMLSSTMEAFTEFMMVGGMPEAVSRYVGGDGLSGAIRALDGIVESNLSDIAKYAPGSEALKIRRTLDSIPGQLSQSNKKFMFSRIDDGGRSREGIRKYGTPLLWIEGSGIGNMCHQLRGISRPLSASADPDQFKVYMSDTGMLLRMMDGDGRAALNAVHTGDSSFNQGALTENVVAECLMKARVPRYFYINRKSPGRMELDFVIGMGPKIAAVEVKSGRDRTAPSLTNTLGDPRFQRRMVLERSNIWTDDDGVEHYPLFAAAFVRDMWDEGDWVAAFGSGSPPPDEERPSVDRHRGPPITSIFPRMGTG